MFKTKLMLLTGVLLLLNGCSGKSDYKLFNADQDVVVEQAIPNQKIEYKILPQDRVSINIYKYPELVPTNMAEEGNGLLVNSEGYIYLPLIHKVKLSGLTQTDAARLLERKYKAYLTDPTLNLEVINKRVYILGEVNKPGVVEVDREKLTIMEALALSGDFTDSAIRDDIRVISHNSQGQMTMRSIDMTDFTSLTLANLTIKPNDIVYVQPSGWKEFKIKSDNITAPFETIAKIASPFVTIKYLTD